MYYKDKPILAKPIRHWKHWTLPSCLSTAFGEFDVFLNWHRNYLTPLNKQKSCFTTFQIEKQEQWEFSQLKQLQGRGKKFNMTNYGKSNWFSFFLWQTFCYDGRVFVLIILNVKLDHEDIFYNNYHTLKVGIHLYNSAYNSNCRNTFILQILIVELSSNSLKWIMN